MLTLVALTIFSFTPYLLRKDLIGFDSYAFAIGICKPVGWSAFNNQNINGFFSLVWLPCNILFFKLFLLACFLLFIFGVMLLAYHYSKKNWFWVTLAVIGLCPALFYFFASFENDAFGFALLVFGFALLHYDKFLKPVGISLLIISGFFWNTAAVFIIALIPFFWFASPFALAIIYFYWKNILTALTVLNASESQLYSLFGIGVLWAFIPFSWKQKKLLLSMLIILFFCCFNTIFYILLIPFIVICVCFCFNALNKKNLVQQLSLIKSLSFICLVGFGFMVILQQPTQLDWKNIDTAISLAEDKNVLLYNDWEVGYWLIWQGHDTNVYGGGKNPDYNSFRKPFVAITKQKLDYCKLIDEGNYFIYFC